MDAEVMNTFLNLIFIRWHIYSVYEKPINDFGQVELQAIKSSLQSDTKQQSENELMRAGG